MLASDDHAGANKRLHQRCVPPTESRRAHRDVCFVATAQELWKTITSVSNAGAKRGRAKRRGATKFKDLNYGQRIGQGNSSER